MKKQQRQLRGMSSELVLEYNSLFHFQIPDDTVGSPQVVTRVLAGGFVVYEVLLTWSEF